MKRFPIRIAMLVMLAVCIYTSALFAKMPINKAASTELKIISESMTTTDIQKIKTVIEAGADVNVKNKYSLTPLIMASQNGYTEIVKLLIQAKADVSAVVPQFGTTSLILASDKGHTETVKLLLKAKANPYDPEWHDYFIKRSQRLLSGA